MKAIEKIIHAEVNMIRVDLGQMEDHIELLRRRIHMLEEWLLDQNDRSIVNKNFEIERPII